MEAIWRVRIYTLSFILAVGMSCRPPEPTAIVEIEVTADMAKVIQPYTITDGGDTLDHTRIFIVPNDSSYFNDLDLYYQFIAREAPPDNGVRSFYHFLRNSVYSNQINLARDPEDFRKFGEGDTIVFIELVDGKVRTARNNMETQYGKLGSNPLIRWPLPWN